MTELRDRFAVKVRSRHVPAPQLIYSFPGEHSHRWIS
jgi:hypothetical protein